MLWIVAISLYEGTDSGTNEVVEDTFYNIAESSAEVLLPTLAWEVASPELSFPLVIIVNDSVIRFLSLRWP